MPDFGDTTVFSQSDAGNATGTMPSWNGAAAPSTIDDAGRALQGAAVREWNWRSYTVTAGGTDNVKTLTYSVAPAAYYNGQVFSFIANTTNTGAVTLNVNSLGAKNVQMDASGTLAAIPAGFMVSGMRVDVAYNLSADCFVWVNQKPVFLDSSGNIGIGVAAPAAKLDVLTTAGRFLLTNNGSANYLSSVNAANNATVDLNINGQTISFLTGAVQRGIIDGNGNAAFGFGNPDISRFRVRGQNAASTNYAFYVENTTPADLLTVRNDGMITTGLAAASPYNLTTASAANVVVTAAGILNRSTSSIRYKTDVRDYGHGLAAVNALRPVSYKGKNDGDRQFAGFIAEEVDQAGLSEFVQYDSEGRPDALYYANMVALLAKALQELDAKFEAYKAVNA